MSKAGRLESDTVCLNLIRMMEFLGSEHCHSFEEASSADEST